jgi:hypothetical protein
MAGNLGPTNPAQLNAATNATTGGNAINRYEFTLLFEDGKETV